VHRPPRRRTDLSLMSCSTALAVRKQRSQRSPALIRGSNRMQNAQRENGKMLGRKRGGETYRQRLRSGPTKRTIFYRCVCSQSLVCCEIPSVLAWGCQGSQLGAYAVLCWRGLQNWLFRDAPTFRAMSDLRPSTHRRWEEIGPVKCLRRQHPSDRAAPVLPATAQG
jgi:hypothetical protein